MPLSSNLLSLAVILTAAYTGSAQSGEEITPDVDIGDAIELSSDEYQATALNFVTKPGDVLTKIVVLYNTTYVKSIEHVSYSLYGSGRTFIRVDTSGNVSLTSMPRVGTTYLIAFSVVVNSIAEGSNITEAVFLSGRIRLRAVDIVGFNVSSIVADTVAFLPIGSYVYNLTDNVKVEAEHIKSYTLAFSGFSSYYTILHSGVLLSRRVFPPGRYSVRVQMDYTVVFKNNTFATRFIYITLTGIAKGCTSREEATLEWPTMGLCQSAQHSCSKYHPSLDGAMVVGYCTREGTPSVPDTSRCCVQSNATNPFAIVWITFSGGSATPFVIKVPAITAAVQLLFPRESVKSAVLYSMYRSNKYYGISMSFNVQLLPSITQEQLQASLRNLKGYRTFARSYLRYERDSRGIRAFQPSSCCSSYSYSADDQTAIQLVPVPMCCGTGGSQAACSCTADKSNCATSAYSPDSCSPCTATNITHPNSAQCSTFAPVVVRDVVAPKNETCVRFDQSTLNGKVYIGAATRNTTVLTVKMVACSDKHIRSFNVRYGLNGYLSDFFDIAKPSGEITLSGVPVEVKLYTFTVSAFVDIVYKNGTMAQNFTEAIVRISVHGGLTMNKTIYILEVPADIDANYSIINFNDEVVIDKTVVQGQPSITFNRVTNSRFGITPKGDLHSKAALTPNLLNYMTLYYSYTSMDVNGETNTFSNIALSVRVRAVGCRQEEGGSFVWPVTHACAVITVPCHHFDSAFDKYGIVQRQCTFEGTWLQPDFSRCRVVAGSAPFVLVWLTFSSVFTKHWTADYTRQTISELQSYMAAFPIARTTIHHNKESNVIYGFVQSYKMELKQGNSEPLNGTLLEILQRRLSVAIRLGGRGKSALNSSSGVLGFTTSDQCIQFDINSGVGDYIPVCMMGEGVSCQCKSVEPALSQCCTAQGSINRTQPSCDSTFTTLQPYTPNATDLGGSLDIYLKLQDKDISVTWELANMDPPNLFEIAWSCGTYQDRMTIKASTPSYTIARVPPGQLCHISVRAYYDNQLSLGSATTSIWIPQSDVLKFQLTMSGVADCNSLKKNMETIRQQLADSIDLASDLSSLGLAVQQCPYGKADDQMSTLTGWIYGTPERPAHSFLPLLQSMADRNALFSIADQKISASRMCDVTKDGMTCDSTNIPTQASLTGGGGAAASTAAIAVLIVVCIIGCVLLAVLLIIVILRFKNKPSPIYTTGVTLSGTSKEVEASTPEGLDTSDTAELQKEF